MTYSFDFSIIAHENPLDVLHNIDQHEDVKQKIIDSIPMVQKNGIETVDPDFQKFVLNYDPLYEAEKTLEIINVEDTEKATMGIGLLNIGVMVAYRAVIKELTMDFSERESTWDEYVKGVESLGFEEFLEVPKEDSEHDDVTKLFWHKEYSILWVLGSFTWGHTLVRKVNDSNIYLSATYRNEGDYGHEISCSRGVTFNTETTHLSCDMRDMPTFKFFKIMESFVPVEYWTEFDCYSDSLRKNLDKVPTEIYNKMISRICDSYDVDRGVMEKPEMQKNLDKVIERFTEDEAMMVKSWVYVFGFESKKPSLLPESIIKKISEVEKADVNAQGYVSQVSHSQRKSEDIRPIQEYALANFDEKALQFWFDKVKELRDSIKYMSIDEDIFAALEKRLNPVTEM